MRKWLQMLGMVWALQASVVSASAETDNIRQQMEQIGAQLEALQQQMVSLQTRLNHTEDVQSTDQNQSNGGVKPNDILYASPVTTTPSLGIRSSYDGSDLIVKFSPINEDLRLLRQRRFYDKHRHTFDHQPNMKPTIELSGRFDVSGLWQQGDNSRYRSDVDLASFELDILTEVNGWIGGIASIRYDNSFNPGVNGDRIGNSRFYLRRGFLTLGNLNKSPWYVSAGQMTVPFGSYDTYMLTAPVTSLLGQTQERALLVGYDRLFGQNEFQMQAYTGASQWNKAEHDHRLNQFGANLLYHHHFSEAVNVDAGIGWVYNIANAVELQDVLEDNDTHNAGVLSAQASAAAIHTQWHYHNWRWAIEYISVLGRLNTVDFSSLSGLPSQIQPRALHSEVNRTWDVHHVPASVSIGGGRSWEGDVFTFPQSYWFASAGAHFWKNTLQTVEFRHNKRYDESDHLFEDKILFYFSVYF